MHESHLVAEQGNYKYNAQENLMHFFHVLFWSSLRKSLILEINKAELHIFVNYIFISAYSLNKNEMKVMSFSP